MKTEVVPVVIGLLEAGGEDPGDPGTSEASLWRSAELGTDEILSRALQASGGGAQPGGGTDRLGNPD